MKRRNILRLFESRRGHLEYRAKRDYVRNGIASIPCRIFSFSDVISPYSVKGYETLNPDFLDYVKTTADVTPPDCPLVLNIIGNCLSPDEKKTIEKIVRDDFSYDLGLAEEPREVFFILFWFMGESLCDYIFLTGHDLRRERRLAGRLASIKVGFSETYEDPDYTESKVEKLYSEIEQDVNETIQEDNLYQKEETL